MNDQLAGKLALVAGGTGALGSAVALAFLEQGGTVVVTYRRQAEFDRLRHAAGAQASRLEGQVVDVTDQSAVNRLVESVISKHGNLDAMTNCVGGYAAGKKLWETEGKTLEQMLALNLISVYVLLRAVVPIMLRLERGAIVNVASTAAIDHAAAASAYVASKSAAVAMVDSLAGDLKGTGVRVNSILPRIIDTEANRKAMPNADYTTWTKAPDIARIILFLCSDRAQAVHGASIPV